MSREVAEKLAKDSLEEARYRGFHTGSPYDDKLFEDIIRMKVERLLADERERFTFERMPTIEEAIKEICKTLRPFDNDVEVRSPYLRIRLKQLIARAVRDEREKVREMCAKEAESWNDTTDWSIARQKVPFRIAKSIRQLDLTKELTRNTDNGGDNND